MFGHDHSTNPMVGEQKNNIYYLLLHSYKKVIVAGQQVGAAAGLDGSVLY